MRKVIQGYVVQEFDKDGNCIAQEFHKEDGNVVSFEDEDGNMFGPGGVGWVDHKYFDLDMVQPPLRTLDYRDEKFFEDQQFDYMCRLFATHANMYGFMKTKADDVPEIVEKMKAALQEYRWRPSE